MSNPSKRTVMIVVAVFAFLVAEAVTFYAYSLLWLAEGLPQRPGDPTLKALAWVCLAAMLAEFVALLYCVVRIYRRYHDRAA